MGHGTVRNRLPAGFIVVVVVKRQKQDEGQISRDDRGFVLVVVCFSAFLQVAAFGSTALPSAKHEVKSIGIIVR